MIVAQFYVDFSRVAQHHDAIDARLTNWGRWCHSPVGRKCSPGFELYRSSDQWAQDAGGQSVDGIDASRIQRHVTQLPVKHRLAICWCYVTRSNPRKAAQSVGESMQGLADLIVNGRQMLINRGA